MDKFTNEELLEMYLGAMALLRLHSSPNGLKLHRDHAREKVKEYREEILRRMEKHDTE